MTKHDPHIDSPPTEETPKKHKEKNMKQEQRAILKEKIIEAVEKITENLSNRMSETWIGGHQTEAARAFANAKAVIAKATGL